MNYEGFDTISRLELNRHMRDVRPENVDPDMGFALVNVLARDDFEKEHIPKSINIPAGQEKEFEKRFSRNKHIVVYCASSECDASPRVASRLVELGFTNVYDYADGMRDWKKSGGPVETGRRIA